MRCNPSQKDGTIREMTFNNVIIAIFWALLVDLYAYQHYNLYLLATAAVNGGDVGSLIDNLSGQEYQLSWTSFEIPHSKDPIIDTLTALGALWEYQLSLTIFTLSFFVNHAYSSWRSGEFQGEVHRFYRTTLALPSLSKKDVPPISKFRSFVGSGAPLVLPLASDRESVGSPVS